MSVLNRRVILFAQSAPDGGAPLARGPDGGLLCPRGDGELRRHVTDAIELALSARFDAHVVVHAGPSAER